MSDGHLIVAGVRCRYSLNGSYHKIEALLRIAAYRVHTTRTGMYREEESRADDWQVYVPVYIGVDLDEARAAEDRINRLFEAGATLTE